MTLRRGFSIKPGQRVLVVEDVVTTGGSVREVLELVLKAGGVVAGVGAIVDGPGAKSISGFRLPRWFRWMCVHGKRPTVLSAKKE